MQLVTDVNKLTTFISSCDATVQQAALSQTYPRGMKVVYIAVDFLWH